MKVTTRQGYVRASVFVTAENDGDLDITDEQVDEIRDILDVREAHLDDICGRLEVIFEGDVAQFSTEWLKTKEEEIKAVCKKLSKS